MTDAIQAIAGTIDSESKQLVPHETKIIEETAKIFKTLFFNSVPPTLHLFQQFSVYALL